MFIVTLNKRGEIFRPETLPSPNKICVSFRRKDTETLALDAAIANAIESDPSRRRATLRRANATAGPEWAASSAPTASKIITASPAADAKVNTNTSSA